MVKRQKEKQYLSAREQKAQGRSRSNTAPSDPSSSGVVQKSLPFKCCALTLVPFETPVCTILDGKAAAAGGTATTTNQHQHQPKLYGIVFDSVALTKFVWKHKKDPVTGNPLTSSRIIKLNMDKDSATGEWQCPVLTKAFSDHNTKIVAVLSPSGGNEANVYSYEAYHELNVKPKSYVDLTTGLKFHPKKDVLILNDPVNQTFQRTVRDVSNFWHIRDARANVSKAGSASGGGRSNSNSNSNIRKSVTASRVMEQIYKDRREKEEKERKAEAAREKAAAEAAKSGDADGAFSFEIPGSNLPFAVPSDDVTGVRYTTGSAALGLTSTSSGGGSASDTRAATAEEILRSRLKLMSSKAWKGKKGYVNLVVEIRGSRKNHRRFSLLLELHCDIAPRTCSNFLGLCRKKRYDGTIFHRYIADFMIQGGGEKLKQAAATESNAETDAKANAVTGKDACLWGPDGFADEFDDRLKHVEGGGVLAMANAGPNTNKQQFYVTMGKACPHLDRKHSVFGSVAKGMEGFRTALTETVRTDAKDRPYLETMDVSNGETTITNAVVVIVATEVLEDPSKEAREKEDRRLTELHEIRNAETKKRKKRAMGGNGKNGDDVDRAKGSAASALGIGKYLSAKSFPKRGHDTEDSKTTTSADAASTLPNLGLHDIGTLAPSKKTKAKAKTKKAKFGNFSSW